MKYPDWLPDAQRPTGPDQRPRRPAIEAWLRPAVRFMHVEASAGVVLLACTVLALVLANSPWAESFAAVWKTRVGFAAGGFELYKPLVLWINDGLMAVFFFVVGLEIKREVVFGELGDPRKAALPVAAAIGGMIVPAAVYLLVQGGGPGRSGWGVPMATDIAFVVGFLALLGPRVPLGLKILLLTLAIVDDIGAILVIALAYSSHTSLPMLGIACGGFLAVDLMRRIGVRSVGAYAVVGGLVWLAFLKSGVHPTVAGVVLGLMTPARSWYSVDSLERVAEAVAARLRREREAGTEQHDDEAALLLAAAARETVSPLDRLERALHGPVAFGIMPLFALANAGVAVAPQAAGSPVALAVAAGLVLGKPLGIFLFSWLAVQVGLARLPRGVDWKILCGAGLLGGVGFTMSLFIAGLALEGELLEAGKIGTLLGSAASALLGLALLAWFLPSSPAAEEKKLAPSPASPASTPAA